MNDELKQEKIITFKLISPEGSWIIGEDPIALLQNVFGTEKGGHLILEEHKQELFGELQDDEYYEYKLVVEKKHTVADIDAMGESDGDIH